jgi:hypothetical protein
MEKWQKKGAKQSPVSDEYFFTKFAIERLDSLDVVDGFGGTIIHDLNTPVPESLYEQFDFIVDGGTFDHLVQIGTAFRNVIHMLKPGGRVLHYNAASGYVGAAYVSFGPDLFYDYYVVNRFADCRVYLLRGTGAQTASPFDVFYLPDARTKQLNSARNQMVVCLAEKATDSISEAIPVEYTYRSPDLRREYAEQRGRILKSKRPLVTCDRPFWPATRETLKRTRIEVSHALERRRAGKFDWSKFRRDRARQLAGTGYVYLGQL